VQGLGGQHRRLAACPAAPRAQSHWQRRLQQQPHTAPAAAAAAPTPPCRQHTQTAVGIAQSLAGLVTQQLTSADTLAPGPQTPSLTSAAGPWCVPCPMPCPATLPAAGRAVPRHHRIQTCLPHCRQCRACCCFSPACRCCRCSLLPRHHPLLLVWLRLQAQLPGQASQLQTVPGRWGPQGTCMHRFAHNRRCWRGRERLLLKDKHSCTC
jgi:hypothetical protein